MDQKWREDSLDLKNNQALCTSKMESHQSFQYVVKIHSLSTLFLNSLLKLQLNQQLLNQEL